MSRMVKKTMALDQDLIDRVRRIFQVRTDKQAVNKALAMVVVDDEIIAAHEQVGGVGPVIEESFE